MLNLRLKALSKKGIYMFIAFWANFHFLQDQLISGRLTCFDTKNIMNPVIVFVDLHFIFEKNV